MDIQKLKEIEAYIMPEIGVFPCDLALLFGTRHGVKEFCDETFRLWKGNFFKHLLISGGCTLGIQQSEAEIIKDQLISLGMPDSIIILEDRSTNTGENVIFSKQVAEQYFGKDAVNSILGIGKISSTRRYLMTIERHWPLEKCFHSVNYFKVVKSEWHKDEDFRNRVLLEWEKIPGYIKEGFLVEIEIP
ncbi:MAG: YdcF family protein [Bacteriovoracaceae bacterium]